MLLAGIRITQAAMAQTFIRAANPVNIAQLELHSAASMARRVPCWQ
jgi:hypothetical protein